MFSVNPLFLRLLRLLLFCPAVAVGLEAHPGDLNYLTIRQVQKIDRSGRIFREPCIHTGNIDYLDRQVLPASLFKVVIARAALLNQVISAGDQFPVEPSFPPGPRDLHSILFHSSNLAFNEIARRTGSFLLGKEALASGLVVGSLPEDFGAASNGSIYRGEGIRTTPRRVHAYFSRLSETAEMDAFLAWPGACLPEKDGPSGVIAAKSGAWGGSAWMAGYCRTRSLILVVTVFVPYEVPVWRPARAEGIQHFYEAMGTRVPSGL